MTHSYPFRAASLALALVVAGIANSDDKPGQKKNNAGDKDAMMAAMMKAATPGPEHKRLDALAGNWTYTMKAWMEPGQPPIESKGTEVRKWILGGRFQTQEVTGDFMGMPFSGYALYGYDNLKKKYMSVWMDSFGTAFSISEGTVDPSGKVFTFVHEDIDPTSGEKARTKDVIRIVGPDKYDLDSWRLLPDGKESKMMEIRCTRAAGANRAK